MSQQPLNNFSNRSTVFIHPTALVEESVVIGNHSFIWDLVHIRKNTKLGSHVSVGGKSIIAYGVQIGNFVKINSMVYICTGVTIEDQCMISAGVIFTNDLFPRAMNPQLTALMTSDPTKETLKSFVRQGATIGAHATIGPGIEIGKYAMVGMGAVVTKDIPSQGLVFGNPARLNGYVCICGFKLIDLSTALAENTCLTCEKCQRRFTWSKMQLFPLI